MIVVLCSFLLGRRFWNNLKLRNNLDLGNNTVQRSEHDESVAQSKSTRSRNPELSTPGRGHQMDG